MRKPYIITGASSGIGYALCMRLASLGIPCVAVARNQDKLLGLKGHYPDLINIINADLSKIEGRNKVVEISSEYEAIAGLVNNAASCQPITLLKQLSIESWHQQLNLNVDAPIFLTQSLLSLLQKGSRIINITSGTVKYVAEGIATYAMTKAALDIYTKYLSAELKAHHILVTSAHPGIVKTDMIKTLKNHNNKELEIVQAQERFTNKKLYLEPVLPAKFLSWLLLEAEESLFTGDVVGIYNKEYQHIWHEDELLSPYPEGVVPP